MFDVNSNSQLYFQAGHKYFTGNHSIRDTSAWYHVVIIYDSANGTAAHRKRVWFNNVEDTGSDVETLGSGTDSIQFGTISSVIVKNIGKPKTLFDMSSQTGNIPSEKLYNFL